MIVIGLTGSIGMGKTAAAGMCRRLGVPVFDADAVVHRLMDHGGSAVDAVAAAFPGAVTGGAIDRSALGRMVIGRAGELARLEAILHPLVRRAETAFLAGCARRRLGRAVLDIPLLFETGGNRLCDFVMVVSAPRHIQSERVLSRPGMTEEAFDAILARQMPDTEKRRRADMVIPTGLGKRRTLRDIIRALRRASDAPARVWPTRHLAYGLGRR